MWGQLLKSDVRWSSMTSEQMMVMMRSSLMMMVMMNFQLNWVEVSNRSLVSLQCSFYARRQITWARGNIMFHSGKKRARHSKVVNCPHHYQCHDNALYHHRTTHQVSVSGKGGLKIKTISFEDSGIYTCMGQFLRHNHNLCSQEWMVLGNHQNHNFFTSVQVSSPDRSVCQGSWGSLNHHWGAVT